MRKQLDVHELPGNISSRHRNTFQIARAGIYRRPVVPSPGVFCHSCYKGTPISFYILVHHVRTRIGSGIYNNGRTSFIGAATATRRPSRIRANKATVDPRLPPEFSRDEITFRQLLGCASTIFPQACAYSRAECESPAERSGESADGVKVTRN
jgi:hypothetical protein